MSGMSAAELDRQISQAGAAAISAKQAAARQRMEKNAKIDKFIRKNPVWNTQYDAKTWGLSEDELFMFQECYAIADVACLGYLGQKQFKDLLKLLQIETTAEQLDTMFAQMDENNDNEISFEEFVAAMSANLDTEQLEMASQMKPGATGTRRWKRGEIVWAANNAIIVVCVGAAVAIVKYFKFIAVPLSMAYFLMFLVSPLMNVMEFRPVKLLGKTGCEPTKGLDEEDDARGWSTKGGLPHGLSVIVTLLCFFGVLAGISSMVAAEAGKMLDDQNFVDQITAAVDDAYQSLNDSGIPVLREQRDGYTPEEIAEFASIFSDSGNTFALITLLWIYLLTEKTRPTVFDATNATLSAIEVQAKNYVMLKTVLSLMTGVLVALILGLLGVKLAVMWGILSFVLNFIPNVGSMIAMFLPMPIVIVDPGLADWQKVLAFVGPGIVQGAVGNAVEPAVFGKSLNLTAMSILGALVIWSALWGLMGAILSVPLLGIQKILLQKTNHPFAKVCVMMIREDPTVDETALASG